MNSFIPAKQLNALPVPGIWRCRDLELDAAARPLIMGIVNVTPDSFSDGGVHPDAAAAIAHALDLVRQGADIIDIGGESTRPGATPVAAAEEIRRTAPVIRGLAAAAAVVISIDTVKSEVARMALDAGAHIINDISALADPSMARQVRETGAGLVLMHKQGEPATMQADPRYGNVLSEVGAFLRQRLAEAVAAGIEPERIVVDPGIGFGKTLEHNLILLANLSRLQVADRPLLIGLSRKRFLGQLTDNRPPRERLAAGLAATAVAVWQGAAIIRTHDVAATRDAINVVQALRAKG